MRHFIPFQNERGVWFVVYLNHRDELIAVTECRSFEAAYDESQAMTLKATKLALCDTPTETTNQGNRYLRRLA